MERDRIAVVLGCVVLVAALLRLPRLGDAPLQAGEAAASWAAWTSAHGLEAPPLPQAPSSALLWSVQALTFWLGGGLTDGSARAACAAVGAALPLAALLWRPLLGEVGALLLAILLAIDPAWVDASRRADGSILASAVTLVAVGLVAGRNARRSGDLVATVPIAIGVLAVSGPLAWDFLLPIAMLLRAQPAAAEPRLALSPERSVTTAGLAALLAGTGAFACWSAATAVSSSLGDWLRGWRWVQPTGTGAPAAWPVLAIAGVAGIVALHLRGSAEHRGLARWLLFATAWGALACVRPGGDPRRWLLCALPLSIAAAGGMAMLPWSGGARARWGAMAVAGALVLGVAGSAAAPLLPTTTGVAPVRLLRGDVQALVQARSGDGGGREVQAIADPWPDSRLEWYLRGIEAVRWVRAPAAVLEAQGERLLIVTRGDDARLLRADGRVLGVYALPRARGARP